MANLVIDCPNERWAKKLYNKCWKNCLKHGLTIKKHPHILYIEDLTNGDTAKFVYSCLDESKGIRIPAHMFKQALGESEKQLRNKEKLMKNAINKCPFCGGEAKVYENKVCAGHGDFYNEVYVVCTTCHARGPSVNDYMKSDKIPMKDIALDKWNRRVD